MHPPAFLLLVLAASSAGGGLKAIPSAASLASSAASPGGAPHTIPSSLGHLPRGASLININAATGTVLSTAGGAPWTDGLPSSPGSSTGGSAVPVGGAQPRRGLFAWLGC